MKKIILSVLLAISFAGSITATAELEPHPVFPLYFDSMEDFLSSLLVVNETEFDDRWQSIIDENDFSAIDKMFFPVALPEGYELYFISIIPGNIAFTYLHENDIGLEDGYLNAYSEDRIFYFGFSRYPLPPDQVWEGRNWQGANGITWVTSCGHRLGLTLPSTHEFYDETMRYWTEGPFFTDEQRDYLTRATQVDLTDTEEVLAMIGDDVRLEDLQFSASGFDASNLNDFVPTEPPPDDYDNGISSFVIFSIIFGLIVIGGTVLWLLLWKRKKQQNEDSEY